jgi:hypothetical protein
MRAFTTPQQQGKKEEQQQEEKQSGRVGDTQFFVLSKHPK